MKKFFAMLLALVMVLGLVACTSINNDAKKDDAQQGDAAKTEYKIAMITDYGNITDQSFNQTTYEACQAFAKDNDITFTYYKPAGNNTADRVAMIEKAADEGYNVMVMPGYAFAGAIVEAAPKFKDVKFIALDVGVGDLLEAGVTAKGESYDYNPDNWKLEDYVDLSNVYCAIYQEELCGYMAGFAAVKLGYTKLGFLGGMAVPAVIRYGYGFVQGADAAAAEMNEQIEIKYWYCGAFSPSDDIKVKMSGWYSEGTEVVFSCGGGIYLSACAAAEEAGAKVIGVDVDQYYVSDTVITSAMKELKHSVVLALTDLYANDCVWPEAYAGTTATLGAADNCVGLPTADTSWRLNNFTVEEYEQLFEAIKSGEIVVSNDTTEAPAVTNSTVDYQE